MKYLALFLIVVSISGLSYEGHSTVVYLESSKAKGRHISKVKKLNTSNKCPSNLKKKINKHVRMCLYQQKSEGRTKV